MIEEFCCVCGERIVPLPGTKHQKYCSEACERKMNGDWRKQRKKEREYLERVESSRERLDRCVVEANRHGMSYGQYMAWRYEHEKE